MPPNSSAAHSSFAHREAAPILEDKEVDRVMGNLSAYEQAKAENVSGSALRRLRQPLLAVGFTEDKIANWTQRIQNTGGRSREGLRRDIRNALNMIPTPQ